MRYSVALSVLLGILFTLFTGCKRGVDRPEPGSEVYQEVLSSFYVGLTALQAGESLGAEEQLVRVTELVPEEPAAWINLAVLAMRANEFELAGDRLARAQRVAPENSTVELLLGRLASAQGDFEQAIVHLRRALELDPGHKKAAYALVQELQRQGDPAGGEEVKQLLESLLDSSPENLAVMLDLMRVAAREGDEETLERLLEQVTVESENFPLEIREQIEQLRTAISGEAGADLETQVAFLRNMLVRLPRFRQDLAEVQIPSELIAEPVQEFMYLDPPPPDPAQPDTSLAFAPEPLPYADESWTWARAFIFGVEMSPNVILANNSSLQPQEGTILSFPGGTGDAVPHPHSITTVDYNYDFLMDLVVAGQGGFRLYRQEANGTYTDATQETGLSRDVIGQAFTGVWAADVDLEGDMDLVLAPVNGRPLVLQNNADGTFTPVYPFEVEHLRGFMWSDYDADGDPDASLLDASGRLHLVMNLRGGVFRARQEPLENVAAHTVGDLDSDAILDLIVLEQDGSLARLSYVPEEQEWERVEMASWEGLDGTLEPGGTLLFLADLDNNGALDIVGSKPDGSFVWLGNEANEPEPIGAIAPAYIMSIADLTGDGLLDFVGVTEDREPVALVNQSTAGYQWKVLYTRAVEAFGEQRINPFGIGGEVEIRSGLLFQKQLITEPAVHFGLGDRTTIDAARIIWPNGNVQAEFSLPSGQAVLASQRLKGSCPWLFSFDGQEMQFVTDFMWRSPLGLAINAMESAGVVTTEDWVKIRSDQLRPHDGFYDVRITADLWESHYFDHIALLEVDHPEGTEIFVDERFAFPPPELKVHLTGPLQPVAGAWDDAGQEVTDLISERDSRYLGGFELGRYQGIARDHYVEVLLGEDVPQEDLVLVAYGWLRPTDSSINVAISQGAHAPPEGLRIEVPDGKGGWRVAREELGSPAGKLKTIVLDLEGLFPEGGERRLRLGTSMEIYWDAIWWAQRRAEDDLRSRRLEVATAELRYRGFSAVHEADRTSPELPIYAQLNGTNQLWRDLVGYYTRYGAVEELLEKVDDRYVIMNAGDELRMTFEATEPPEAGWTRDYVLIGDGWNKDGDYNTTFSKTVLPLPTHANGDYSRAPGRLKEDPVYQAHPQDWVKYHTRFVGTEGFQQALLPSKD